MSEPSTALTLPERVRVALKSAEIEQGLAELAGKSKHITEITNAAGYQQAHSARMALKTQRIIIEKTSKEARQDATDFSKGCIVEERRLVAIIQAEEERLGKIQDGWDAARAAEKKAREEAERARVQEIQRRLARIEALPETYTSAMPPEKLADVVAQLETGLTFDYQEFSEQAEKARQAAIVALRQAHAEASERVEREAQERAAREAEEARQAAERKAEEERLAEVRRQLDAEKAERTRQAEADRLERERVAQIRQWIVALNGPTHLTASDSPMLIDEAIDQLLGAVVDERYQEFRTEAAEAREGGIQRLRALVVASRAQRAEQARLTREREELERQQREQAERQAEIDRREREQREEEERRRREAAEAEQRRLEEERATRERDQAEAARREAETRRREEQRRRVGALSAADIVDLVREGLAYPDHPVDERLIAARIAEIPHEDWAAIASEAEEEVAA